MFNVALIQEARLIVLERIELNAVILASKKPRKLFPQTDMGCIHGVTARTVRELVTQYSWQKLLR